MEVIINVPSKLNKFTQESEKARILASQYKSYFSKPKLTKTELFNANRILKEYIKETNYKIND